MNTKTFKVLMLITILGYHLAYSQNLQQVFELAGDNRKTFEIVLEHYKDDSEKHKAALFLIENMHLHKSVDYLWYKNGSLMDFSEYDYPDYHLAYKDIRERLEIDNIKLRKRIKLDINYISSETLIKNIDLAFTEWNNNPWSTSYSFETFCEYILPYRNLTEPLENWRNVLKNLATTPYIKGDETDPVDVCSKIITGLEDFTFIAKRPDPTTILSPNQMLFRRQGSCPDLANFAVLVTRSRGVATTYDFTPHYAASSNRHFWNTVIDSNGEHIPFNSNSVSECEDCLPYLYNANKKRLGKVFRITYSDQKTTLANYLSPADIPATFLKKKNIKDVTQEYVKVTDIYIDSKKFNDTIAYLNVFNLGKWKTIEWGKLESRGMFFKNMGRNVVYLPSTYKNRKISYAKHPFLVDKKGIVHELQPDNTKLQNVTLSRENEFKTNFIDFNTTEIIEGEKYTLYYWSNGWRKVSQQIAKENEITFSNTTTNALFMLTPEKPDNFERVFIIEPDSDTIFWY